MQEIIAEVRLELQSMADETIRQSAQAFFKEEIQLYGVKTAMVRDIAKVIFKKIKDLPKKEVFALCEKLWQSGYFEETVIASFWADTQRKKFESGDFAVFERWISNYVHNWASCDTFCTNPMGEFLLMYPEHIKTLKKWAKSDNRWVRRAAAVSFILPGRKGKYLDDILEIADLQLTDNDDLVQKGYGWMLKVASQKHEEAVFEFVMKHKALMPRTALRYAIEKMPADLKAEAMKR